MTDPTTYQVKCVDGTIFDGMKVERFSGYDPSIVMKNDDYCVPLCNVAWMKRDRFDGRSR